MTQIKRTDVHAPSRINPIDYDFVAVFYKVDFYTAPFILEQREILNNHMERTGGTWSTHEHGGNCHICGAWMIYYAVFHHIPTNTYIRTGLECAAKLDYQDKSLFEKAKNERQAVEKAKAGKLKATGLLNEHGILDFVQKLHGENFEIVNYPDDAPIELKELINIVISITDNLIKWGNLSDKQWNFLNVLRNKIENFYEIKAKRDAEHAQLADAPTGRKVVKGKVLSVKMKDSFYGQTLKMLVQDESGFKVWSTVPSNVANYIEKGNDIEFTVTLKPSNDDTKFAFGSRPASAKLI